MIDDSIVRGTTSRQIVVLLREAGAVQVHLRISAPPFITPCYFGTDIPDSEHLIAHDRSPEEICALTGADSLGFLPLKVLHQIAPDAGAVAWTTAPLSVFSGNTVKRNEGEEYCGDSVPASGGW